MLLIIYLLSGVNSIKNFSEGQLPIIIFIGLIELIIYLMPLFIAIDVNRIKMKNNAIQEELKEIKNLMIYQNEILNSMRIPPYNQYYQQQQPNQNYQQNPYNNTSNNNFSQP